MKKEPPYVALGKTIMPILRNLIGKTVCVSWILEKEKLRKNFEPQISVQGKLEGSADTGKYRVLVDDNNYSYFYDTTTWMVVHDVDKRPIIFIG